MKLRLLIASAAILAACGDDDRSATTGPTNTPSAVAAADEFCAAMDELIVLLTPSDEPTSPAETEATFDAASVQFQRAVEAAPAALSADVDNYANANERYIEFLQTVDYNLDVVFSTEEGRQLAIDTSHSLTPAIVEYVESGCGLSFGPEEQEPPTT